MKILARRLALVWSDSLGESHCGYNFVGVGIEALRFQDMFDLIDSWLLDKSGRSRHIACVNAYCVALAKSDLSLREIYNSADIVGPDGMPFVKWMRRVLEVPCDRFYGPDIAMALAARAEVTNYSFYLYGASPAVLANMERHLLELFPHIRIVGSHSPPFRPLTPDEDREICSEINRLQPDILLVGLGTPKQDFWISDHLTKLHGTVMVASGATFDFFGGRVPMASERVRNSGFEWLYRLFGKDFFRLLKRYTWHNLRFVLAFSAQLLGLRTYQLPNGDDNA